MSMDILEKLEEEIKKLRDLVSKYNTEPILGHIGSKIHIFYGQDIFESTGLSSPLKQYLYLAGILMSTPKKVDTKEFNKKEEKKVNKILNNVVNLYSLMFFPTKEQNRDSLDENWYKAREISMPFFLNYFNTGALVYQDQQINRIRRWFLPFNSYIKSTYNLDINILIDIYLYIGQTLQKQLDTLQELMEEVDKERKIFFDTMEQKNLSVEETRECVCLDKTKEFMKTLSLMFHVSINDLKEKFDQDIIDSFINIFSIDRVERDYKYYTEKNPIESAPIWKKSEDYLFCSLHRIILSAIYDFLYSSLEASSLSESFYKHRDKEAVNETLELFRKMFKEDASYYLSVFNDNKSTNENDLLVIYKDVALIVEVKASKVKEPFRDPDKAYIRIKRDFKSDRGIQKAYDQGLRLKKLLQSKNNVSLFDQQGRMVVSIDASQLRKIYIICITADNFGPIACNLSFLLDKPEDEPYPWACNLFDFDSIVNGFSYMNLSANDFLKYLDEREILHEKLFCTDELEICGYFLQKGNFNEYKVNVDRIFFTPQMSDIFDEIYFAQHGLDISFEKSEPILYDMKEIITEYYHKKEEKRKNKKKKNIKKKLRKIAKNSKKKNRKKRH